MTSVTPSGSATPNAAGRLCSLLFLVTFHLPAQPQVFDAYSFSVPAGYTQRSHKDSVELSKVDQKNRYFCQIGLYRAQPSLGTAAQDIDAEWKAVVEKQFKLVGAANTKPFPLPGAPDSISRFSETETAATGKILTLLIALRYPGRYVGVLVNASHAQAMQACTPDVSSLIATLKWNDPASPPAVTSGTSPVGQWEKVIVSRPPTRYNPITKQWEYSAVEAMMQFKQVHRFRFDPDGRYTYTLDADDYNRSERSQIIEQGSYTIAAGAIQFQPRTYQDGKGPKNQNPPLTTRATPAPHVRRFSVGEHPQYKDSAGLQLQNKDGAWETFRPAK